jgi:hypothetical protein
MNNTVAIKTLHFFSFLLLSFVFIYTPLSAQESSYNPSSSANAILAQQSSASKNALNMKKASLFSTKKQKKHTISTKKKESTSSSSSSHAQLSSSADNFSSDSTLDSLAPDSEKQSVLDSLILDTLDPKVLKSRAIFTDIIRHSRLFDGYYGQQDDLPGNSGRIFRFSSQAGQVAWNSPYNTSGQLYSPLGFAAYWPGSPQSLLLADDKLNLQGSNAQLILPFYTPHPDTPAMTIQWETGAFETNQFNMHFQRMFSSSIALELGVATHSNDNSAEWSYQDITHQPFSSGIGRDSSKIPFYGRNMGVNSYHFIPMIHIYQGQQSWSAWYSKYRNQAQQATPQMVEYDSLEYTPIFMDEVVDIDQEERLTGFRWQWKNMLYTLSAQYRSMEGDTEIDNPNEYRFYSLGVEWDSLFADTSLSQDSLKYLADSLYPFEISNWKTITRARDWEFKALNRNNSFLPSMLFSGSFQYLPQYLKAGLQKEQQSHEEDYELLQLQQEKKWEHFSYSAEAGVWRYSSPLDSQEIHPVYAGNIHWNSSWLNAKLWHRKQHQSPSLAQRYLWQSGLLHFPQQNLKTSQWKQLGFSSELSLYKYAEIGGEWILEEGRNPILPSWYFHSDDILDDADAWSWNNAYKYEGLQQRVWAALNISNWKFFLEQSKTLDENLELSYRQGSSENLKYPLLYRGFIRWQNHFVKKRLGVLVQWEWEWFPAFTSIAHIANTQTTERIKLPHYLVLDFMAQMRIADFQLYTRIENMNHSQYAPSPGFTPAGIHFRYGISWLLNE